MTPRVEGIDDLVEIGRGGASVVYAGTQQPFGRPVAVKVFGVALGDDGRRRFEREAAVIGALGDCRGIVAVHASAVADDGRPCTVMPLMAASLASTVAAAGGRLDAVDVVPIGVAVAEALSRAHDRGVTHRDVKPENILASDDGDWMISDFDIAGLADRSASTRTLGSFTPGHAPPERLDGTDRSPGVDESTAFDLARAGDIWSLGSTLYTALEGRPPFGSADDPGGVAGLVDRVRSGAPISFHSPAPDALRAAIERALHRDPSQRWPDARSFAEVLRSVPDAPAAPATPATPARRDGAAASGLGPGRGRGRGLGLGLGRGVVVVAVACVVVVVLAAAFWIALT